MDINDTLKKKGIPLFFPVSILVILRISILTLRRSILLQVQQLEAWQVQAVPEVRPTSSTTNDDTEVRYSERRPIRNCEGGMVPELSGWPPATFS